VCGGGVRKDGRTLVAHEPAQPAADVFPASGRQSHELSIPRPCKRGTIKRPGSRAKSGGSLAYVSDVAKASASD
jgi:hypothetical protein